MDVVVSALPLILVVVLMAGPRPQPAWLAVPITAVVAWVLRLWWFGADGASVHAAVAAGLLAAATPLLIVGGAIHLFAVLDRCGALATWRAWLDTVTPHPLARVLTVGWAFAYLLEGASGFGTPAALAAPILVACGMPALRAVVVCLAFNSVPVSFGALGTPVWFGFAGLDLDAATVTAIGARSALIHAWCALPVVVVILRLAFTWATIRASWRFVVLAVAACVLPALAVAQFGAEFPSLIGGGVGLVVTALAAQRGWGLGAVDESDRDPPRTPTLPPAPLVVLRAFAPLLACVVLLVVTRLPSLPLRGWLTALPQQWWDMGSLGQIGLSPGLTLVWRDILGTGISERLAILFVPGILPFLVVAVITPWLVGSPWANTRGAVRLTVRRLRAPAVALGAGLILVRLLQQEDSGAPASTRLLGEALAGGLGPIWHLVAPMLGALGSFFSGSCTMANLTFGPVQLAAATRLGLDPVAVLAGQNVGAAFGNMTCIHNIVAATSILGLTRSDHAVLRRTIGPMVFALVLTGVIGWLLALGFPSEGP